jgi:uncharacterized protein DUF6894
MPRYYFHVEDGRRIFDDVGEDLPDISAAQTEALRASNDVLKGGPMGSIWRGTPWRLWVTNMPNGEGTTFLTLRFSGEMAGG